jgi:hypothetical protein
LVGAAAYLDAAKGLFHVAPSTFIRSSEHRITEAIYSLC